MAGNKHTHIRHILQQHSAVWTKTTDALYDWIVAKSTDENLTNELSEGLTLQIIRIGYTFYLLKFSYYIYIFKVFVEINHLWRLN